LLINTIDTFAYDEQDLSIDMTISDMTPPIDPTDFSKFRSVQPNEVNTDGHQRTAWEQIKNNFSMLVEVTKNKPIGETLCMKEALIFGR
jgi:hypothetical protein